MPSLTNWSAATFWGSWPSWIRPRFTTVLHVGQLDPAVADRAAAILVEDGGFFPDLRRDRDTVAEQEALVTAAVAEDFDLGRDFRVALDQSADSGRETGGETARSEYTDFLYAHNRISSRR